MPLTVT